MNVRRAPILLLILFAVLLIAAVGVGILLRLPADGTSQWDAITGGATLVLALASILGLGGLFFLAREAGRARQQMRVEFGPYLRVDLAPDMPGGTFRPPAHDGLSTFEFRDFNPGETEPETALSPWLRSDGIDICLWVQNQQGHPGGTAHNITVTVELVVPDHQGDDLEQQYEVTFHYVEPGRRVCYRLGTVDRDIPFLFGRVVSLGYYDMHQKVLHFGHGSARFEWIGKFLANFRSGIFRNRRLWLS